MPSYSYNPAALNLPLNQIRFLIGDTDPDNWRLQDDEINAVAPGGAMPEASVNLAAARLCERLASRYAGLVDISEGAASASLSQLADNYRKLAVQLRRESAAQAPAWAKPEIIDGTYPPAFASPTWPSSL
jgi:hypothetical protein